MQYAPETQNGPFVSSHASPSAARATHALFSHVPSVQATTCVPTMPHGAPELAVVAMDWQVPFEQLRAGPQGCVAVHAPPLATGDAHVPPAHSSPGAHWSVVVHGCPAAGAAWQVPQAAVENAQNPDWH